MGVDRPNRTYTHADSHHSRWDEFIPNIILDIQANTKREDRCDIDPHYAGMTGWRLAGCLGGKEFDRPWNTWMSQEDTKSLLSGV